jgi:uncharacterized membrane-anchored protein YitT (DUF2179 family)
MYFKVSKKWQFALDILMIVIGTIVMGFAFSVFLEPNNISTGGFSGLAMIIKALLSKVGVEFLSTSVIYLILNVGLFLYALKTLGKKFAIKSIIGIVAYSGAMELFAILPINLTYETLISAVYGGALMGIGLGIVVRFGGSTGGGDMIASIVKNKIPRLTIGKIVITVDLIVIFLSLFTFSNGIIILPYTVLALMLALFTTDFVNEGYKQIRAYNIITTKPNEVSSMLMQKLSRGCTQTNVKGMHSGEEKYILTCLISKFQANYLKRIIKETDESAFVYSVAVSEVIGSWTKESELPMEEKKVIKPKKLTAKKADNQKIIKDESKIDK